MSISKITFPSISGGIACPRIWGVGGGGTPHLVCGRGGTTSASIVTGLVTELVISLVNELVTV